MPSYNVDALTAGNLQWRITLQRANRGVDALNNPATVWSDLATVWASWEDVSDSERIASAGTEAEISTRFQIRFSSAVSDLNPKDRVKFRGFVYDIAAVKMIGRNVGLEISAGARADLKS
jgi:SPP1 family predicted phage head-tail adaptor